MDSYKRVFQQEKKNSYRIFAHLSMYETGDKFKIRTKRFQKSVKSLKFRCSIDLIKELSSNCDTFIRHHRSTMSGLGLASNCHKILLWRNDLKASRYPLQMEILHLKMIFFFNIARYIPTRACTFFVHSSKKSRKKLRKNVWISECSCMAVCMIIHSNSCPIPRVFVMWCDVSVYSLFIIIVFFSVCSIIHNTKRQIIMEAHIKPPSEHTKFSTHNNNNNKMYMFIYFSGKS